MTTESRPRIKITYATLRNDNEELHALYEAGVAGSAGRARCAPPELHRRALGATVGGDVRGPLADRSRDAHRDVREGRPERRPGRDRGRAPGRAGVASHALAGAPDDPPSGGRVHLGAPDALRRRHGLRGRQEPARGAGRGRGGRRPDPLLRADGRGQQRLRPPDGQPRGRNRPHPLDPEAARRVRGDQPVQLPDGAVHRSRRGRAARRQHGRPQAGVRGAALGGQPDPRPPGRRRPGGRREPRDGPGRHRRRRAPVQPGDRRHRLHRLVRGRVQAVQVVLDRLAAAVHRGDGRQEPGDRVPQGGPRGGGRGDHAQRVRVRRAEVLRELPRVRRAAGPRRAGPDPRREDREAHGRRPDRSGRTGSARSSTRRRSTGTSRRSPRSVATGWSTPAAST